MGSYTAVGTPMKVVTPPPRQKIQDKIPKINLHLNNEMKAGACDPCSTISSSKSHVSQLQIQKLKKPQQANLVHSLCQQPTLNPILFVDQLTQFHETQEPQFKPIHLVNQPMQENIVPEQQNLKEPRYATEKSPKENETVTFAKTHHEQYGRCTLSHGGSDLVESIPTHTKSVKSTTAQGSHGHICTAKRKNRRPHLKPIHLVNLPSKANIFQEQPDLNEPQSPLEQSIKHQKTVKYADVHYDHCGRCSPIDCGNYFEGLTSTKTISARPSSAQSIYGNQSTEKLGARSFPTQIIQTKQSTAQMTYGRSSPPVKNVYGDQRLAFYDPKIQGHKIRVPNNKRKAIIQSPPFANNMQLSLVLPNHKQMVSIPKTQVETQQVLFPQGYKVAGKGSISDQNIIIRIVIK